MKYRMYTLSFIMPIISISLYAKQPIIATIAQQGDPSPRLVRAFLLTTNPQQLNLSDSMHQDLSDLFALATTYQKQERINAEKKEKIATTLEQDILNKMQKITAIYGPIWHKLYEADKREIALWYIVYNRIFELYRKSELPLQEPI